MHELDKMMENVRNSVERNRYQRKDLLVLAQAQAILQHTKAVSGRLRRMRTAILEHVDNDHPAYNLPRLLQPSYNLSVDSLYKDLQVFAAYMHRSVPQRHSLSMPHHEAHPALLSLADYQRTYFEDADAAETLSILAQQEAEVLQLGLDGLTEQAKQVGITADVFEKYTAFAVAESNSVRAGEKYKAELFLLRAASSEGRNPRMTVNGTAIVVDENGRGHVEFTVPHAQSNQQSQRAVWQGTIAVRLNGRDSTFQVMVPYTITR